MTNVEVIREIFRAIEQRDGARLLELFHPDVEFHWPRSLPYGGNIHERPGDAPTWAETWIPLQPTATEQYMALRIIAARDDEVVGLWRQKGRTPAGDCCDVEVVGLYVVRDGKLARAQMFYFDSAEVAAFLAKAAG